ncbi:hypothetical protein Bbelb_023830 [Branchiostoma belcheri]|nr:hypothetical protein Bbelb_023830 [Branchiostoma belcheri]
MSVFDGSENRTDVLSDDNVAVRWFGEQNRTDAFCQIFDGSGLRIEQTFCQTILPVFLEKNRTVVRWFLEQNRRSVRRSVSRLPLVSRSCTCSGQTEGGVVRPGNLVCAAPG